MSAKIIEATGAEAYELLWQQHISKLSLAEQETMRRWMVTSTNVWIGYDEALVLGVWGLVPPTLLSDRAYLWLHVTEHLHEHEFIFIRYSQRAVADMLKRYPIIIGHTILGNDKAIRWLRWLGAVFAQPENGAIAFEIRAKHG